MARWPRNAHPIIMMAAIAIGSDRISIGMLLNRLQSARIVYWWVHHWIDCNQLGSYTDWYIVELIAISSDSISMGIGGGFDGGFDSGFDGGFEGRFNSGSIDWFYLAVLGYQPQQSVQQLRQEAFTAISREGLTGSSSNKLVVLQAITVLT